MVLVRLRTINCWLTSHRAFLMSFTRVWPRNPLTSLKMSHFFLLVDDELADEKLAVFSVSVFTLVVDEVW